MKKLEWNGKRPVKDPILRKYDDPCEDIISIEYQEEKIFCSFQSSRLIHGILKNLQQYKKYELTEVEHIDYVKNSGEKRPVRIDIVLPLSVLTLKSKRRKNARAVISKGGR